MAPAMARCSSSGRAVLGPWVGARRGSPPMSLSLACAWSIFWCVFCIFESAGQASGRDPHTLMILRGGRPGT
eukprot:11997086-Heterocapsa_arctica.AAC.1